MVSLESNPTLARNGKALADLPDARVLNKWVNHAMIQCDSLFALRENNLKQLSLRGFDPELAKKIHELARKKGISLNRATIFLLRKGAGLSETGKSADVVGDSLDHLIGKWSKEECREFMKSIASLEQIDRSFWK